MSLKIGNTELSRGVMLAPMAGYTDRAMRKVCHELGAEWLTTEMISAKAVVYGDKKTLALAKIEQDEGPTALQLFGSEPDILAKAAEVMQRAQSSISGGGEPYTAPSAIDINMGCPVHKIFSNGEGSALMRDPELIYRIVKSVKGAIDIPLSVKLRSGVDKAHINALECALAAEAGGADFVTVHGRTKVQMYSGFADLEIISKVKQALHIPVIANGDVCDAASALNMFKSTGCDGIMIGRAAIGNPFIFAEIISVLSGKEIKAPTLSIKKEVARRQLQLAVLDKGETVAVREARKQLALYFKGYRGASALCGSINRAQRESEISELIESIEE